VILADTDVLIDYLRGHGPAADRIALELEHGLATTVVSAFELWAGSLGSGRRERAVQSLLGALRIVPLDEESSRMAAEVRHQLQARGRTLAMADALIAGICIQSGAVLLTRNTRHFQDIPRLALGGLGPV